MSTDMSTDTSNTLEVGQWITDPTAPADQPAARHRLVTWGTITADGTRLYYKGDVATMRAAVRAIAAGRNPATYPGGLGAFLGYLGRQLDDGYTWARYVMAPTTAPTTPPTADTPAAAHGSLGTQA